MSKTKIRRLIICGIERINELIAIFKFSDFEIILKGLKRRATLRTFNLLKKLPIELFFNIKSILADKTIIKSNTLGKSLKYDRLPFIKNPLVIIFKSASTIKIIVVPTSIFFHNI